MLRELSVENFAIIDQARLELDGGLTALTGETGAGKSLLVDAIGLALGGRSSAEMVRAGAAKAVVVLHVDLSGSAPLQESCSALGIDLDEGALVIQREVAAGGGSTVRFNGRAASVSALRELGRLLVDLHGQHDHQSLLDEERQIAFLDDWIGSEVLPLKQQVASAHAAAEELRRRLSRLRSNRREREQRIDMLQFQIDEIRQAEPRPGESEELEQLIARLQNVERLRQAAATALEALSLGDSPVLDQIRSCSSSLESGARIDDALSEPSALLASGLDSLEEASRLIGRYLDGLEADPERLQASADRLDSLKKLRRKYGDTEEAILEFLARAEEELGDLTSGGSSEEDVEDSLHKAEEALSQAAARLTKVRKAKAKEFQTLVVGHIRELAMEKAEFSVDFSAKSPDPEGADLVSFLFSANPGEPVLPLAKVASGGEISRVMLAIKAAGAGRAGVPTLIFDEVDTGLSGRAAAVMAKKLRELALHRQVIAISHLPQIAGQARQQWRIEKALIQGRSVTRLLRLAPEERVEELARMLAGETITPNALANARELLADPVDNLL